MMDLIRYINKVEVIDAEYLASSTFFSKGVKLDDALTFVPLCMIGLATFEISEKVESKNRLFHHSLKAKLSERIDVGNRKLCFRLTAVDGTQYMMGSDSRPYPLVFQDESHPSDAGQSCAVILDVTWKSTGFYPVL